MAGLRVDTNLDYLVLTDKSGMPLLEFNFVVERFSVDNALLTGFVSAISAFAQELYSKKLKSIDHGDLKLEIVEGNVADAIFLTPEVTDNLQIKVETLLEKFEAQYKESVLMNMRDSDLFDDFREVVAETFTKEILREFYVPTFTGHASDTTLTKEAFAVISCIDDKRTIAEIIKKSKINEDEVLSTLAWLRAYNLVNFQVAINQYVIPLLTGKGTNLLVNKGKELEDLLAPFKGTAIDCIAAIDGKSSAKTIGDAYSLSKPEITRLMNILLTHGYIDLLSSRQVKVFVLEKLYNTSFKALTEMLGAASTKSIKNILENDKNPLIQLLNMTNDNTVSFDRLKTHLTTQPNLDGQDLIETFLPPIHYIWKPFEKLLGDKGANNIKSQVLDQLEQEFGPDEINPIRDNLSL